MENIKKLGISGSMSGWEEYNTDMSSTALGAVPKKYTIPELLSEINNIKKILSKEKIEELFVLLENHLHDNLNPHELTLETLGTSVIYELYNTWIDKGYVGSVDDFLKVLFQYVEIATPMETLHNPDSSKLVSIKGSKFIYDNHIQDPNAHDEMFRAMFPGKAVTTEPIFSSHAFLGIHPDMEIIRPSICYYHDPAGYLKTVGENELPIDHIYNEPMYSIWNERTNLVTNSFTLADGEFINVSPEINHETFKNLLGEYETLLIRENTSNVTNKHGWKTDNITFEAGKIYTVSVYAYPINKNYLTIKIPGDLNNDSIITHSLVKDNNYYKWIDYDDEINHGEAVILPNGWVRVSHTFKALMDTNEKIEILFTEIIDGDLTYISNNKLVGALSQVQVEEGLNASPPIITQDYPITRPATSLKIPFGDLFNVETGTLIISVKKIPNISGNHNLCLYEIGSDESKTVSAIYKNTDISSLTITSYNSYQEIIDEQQVNSIIRNICTYVHSYGDIFHTYGNTGYRPISNVVADKSIGYSEALNYALLEIWNNIEAGNTYLIDYVNPFITTTINIDDLNMHEILDNVLVDIFTETSQNRGTNEIAFIDFIESTDAYESISLCPDVNYLYIGKDHLEQHSFGGYISNIIYYEKYCDNLETEFLIGEYADGTQS